MKYILTDNNNVIINISNKTILREDGYFIEEINTVYPTLLKLRLYEMSEIPSEAQTQKYCYTEEKGFYKNSNYKEYYTEEQRISALEDVVNTLLGF